MWVVMEMNPSCCLPEHLDQAYAAEVTAPNWGQYYSLPGTLFCKVTLVEVSLNQSNNLLPMGGFVILFPRCGLRPVLEMFRSSPGWSPCPCYDGVDGPPMPHLNPKSTSWYYS